MHGSIVTSYEGKSGIDQLLPIESKPLVAEVVKSFEEDKTKINQVLREATNYWQDIHAEAVIERESKQIKMLTRDAEALTGICF
jgi:hypothetical protein